MFTITKTNATTETTTTPAAHRRFEAYQAKCRAMVAPDRVADRIEKMCAELTALASAAGEVAAMDLMEHALEARASLVRLLEGPAGCEREASGAWNAIRDVRVRHAIGALLASVAAAQNDAGPVGEYLVDEGTDIGLLGQKPPRKSSKAKGSRRGGGK